ncbi:MAG: hypothetical protein LBP59_13375 [Planctomycetaceae bacterium]|jgi:hypothetical protein|nr:hypothetical protein [Planctomycetaceae bacterium]
MDYDKYIFVDYENVQDIDVDIIDKNIKVVIIVGETQNKIPINLIQKTQPLGDSIEWMQIKSNGKKNALDFFIVYFLGYYIFSDKDKEYIIYSKDTGYDPLIDFLNNKKIKVRRIDKFKQINVNKVTKEQRQLLPLPSPIADNTKKPKEILNKAAAENQNKTNDKNLVDLLQNLKRILNKVGETRMPKTKKSLTCYLKSILKKSDDEVEKIIEKLLKQKNIYEEDERLKYNLK